MQTKTFALSRPALRSFSEGGSNAPTLFPSLTFPRSHALTLFLSLPLFALFAFSAVNLPAGAQTASGPPLPPAATNAVSAVAPFEAGLSLLPYWDKTLTNTFLSGEFTLEAAPLWRAMAASGSTPYASVEADYFVERYLGLGGELVVFGNGQGSSSVDSALVDITLRKDLGNIAGYLMAGFGRDFNQGRFEGAFGPGIIYRYSTGVGLFVDTRWQVQGTASQNNGWLTRVGLQLHF